MRYAYDSGCSRASAGSPAGDGAREVALALGLTLEEVSEPAGCAASGPAMNGIPAYARVGRLLALAARQLAGRQDARDPPTLVTPCSACYRSLSRASRSLGTHAELRRSVAEELAAEGLSLGSGEVRVRHLLEVLHEDGGPGAIRARVTRPLTGLRVAPYLGCLAGRPGAPAEDGSEPDTRLEELLSALGADVVDLPLRAHCCGGSAAGASLETGTSLQVRILRSAAERNADLVATACPRCARNLASGQDAVNRRYATRFEIPVRFFTSLVADAFGLDGVRS